MTGVLIVSAFVAGLVAFDRLMLAAEARGWVRWRRSPPTRASANTALLEILSIYEPAHQHVVEERRATDADDEAGDDDPIGRLDPFGRLEPLGRRGPLGRIGPDPGARRRPRA